MSLYKSALAKVCRHIDRSVPSEGRLSQRAAAGGELIEPPVTDRAAVKAFRELEIESMSEKELEDRVVASLQRGIVEPARLAAMRLTNASLEAQSLYDLCGSQPYRVFQNDSQWNTHEGFMQDVAGGMMPDIVVRSQASGQNRIYIEVKETQWLGYSTEDSQIVRYFLHLLAVSEKEPNGVQDIDRAIILAAPSDWFERSRTGTDWRYFTDTYTPLARIFRITLAELHLDNAQSWSE